MKNVLAFLVCWLSFIANVFLTAYGLKVHTEWYGGCLYFIGVIGCYICAGLASLLFKDQL